MGKLWEKIGQGFVRHDRFKPLANVIGGICSNRNTFLEQVISRHRSNHKQSTFTKPVCLICVGHSLELCRQESVEGFEFKLVSVE